MNQKTGCLFAVLSVALLSGCGGVYEASVEGMVVLDDSPITRGTVCYNPKSGGPSAYGQITNDGSYVLRTGRAEGMPPGEYVVTVVANEPPAQKQTKTGGPPPAGKEITPPWSRSAKTSGLSYTIESGSNEINLELSSDTPVDWKPPKKRRRR